MHTVLENIKIFELKAKGKAIIIVFQVSCDDHNVKIYEDFEYDLLEVDQKKPIEYDLEDIEAIYAKLDTDEIEERFNEIFDRMNLKSDRPIHDQSITLKKLRKADFYKKDREAKEIIKETIKEETSKSSDPETVVE